MSSCHPLQFPTTNKHVSQWCVASRVKKDSRPKMEVNDVKTDFGGVFWEESDTRSFSGYLILRHSHIKAEVVLFAIEGILNNATDSSC